MLQTINRAVLGAVRSHGRVAVRAAATVAAAAALLGGGYALGHAEGAEDVEGAEMRAESYLRSWAGVAADANARDVCAARVEAAGESPVVAALTGDEDLAACYAKQEAEAARIRAAGDDDEGGR